MRITKEDGVLTVYLTGEIDHHTAKAAREEADAALTQEKPHLLRLDFSGVTFMDSSGVGLIMGRYQKAAALGAAVTVRGLTRRDERIVKMAGLGRLIRFEERKEITV